MRQFELLERRDLLSAAAPDDNLAAKLTGLLAPAILTNVTAEFGSALAGSPDGPNVAPPVASPTTSEAPTTAALDLGAAADFGSTSSELRVASDYMQEPTIFSIRAGHWSDPSTWFGNRLPTAADDVLISHDVTIDQGQAHTLQIMGGTTQLVGELHAYGSVIVHSKLAGTQGTIYFHVADDRLFTGNTRPGPDPDMPDFHPEDTGLWVMPGGVIDLTGEYVTPWLDAVETKPRETLRDGVSQAVAFDSGLATLAYAPVGWRPGDTLLLVNEKGQEALADLVSVQGQTIVYQERKASPSDPDFVAHSLFAGTQPELTVNPKIANLSRRLQIVSADVVEGDTHHRAHVLVMADAAATIRNVELRDLGPREKLGRYPVHFHHGGASESVLEGSAIWQDVTDPGNRFVAIHNVQNVRVANNVGFRSRGHGFFMESGPEFNNQIIGNLSVDVTGPEELAGLENPIGSQTHHFWLRLGNTIEGNVAAGGGAIGLVVLLSTGPVQSTHVVGMQTLGVSLYGMWSGVNGTVFDSPVSVYSARAGFGTGVPLHTQVGGMVLNNPLFLLNGETEGYGSQVFLNASRDNLIYGGVLAGKIGIHVHYASTLMASGTQIYSNSLFYGPWWDVGVRLEFMRISVARITDQPGSALRQAPGLLRIVDSSLRVAGGPWQDRFSADFSSYASARFPGFSGTPVLHSIQLTTQAPLTGFIRVPSASELNGATPWKWTVTPVGQIPASPTVISESEERWRATRGIFGYSNGFPPGTYVVELFDSAGKVLNSGYVVVRSDEVSQITFSQAVLPGDLNFDGLVNIHDINVVSAVWGQMGASGDANFDRKVNIFDLNFIASHWSQAGAPPANGFPGGFDDSVLGLVQRNFGKTTPEADLNHDGIVDIFDLNVFSQSRAGGPAPAVQTGLRIAPSIVAELRLSIRQETVDAVFNAIG